MDEPDFVLYTPVQAHSDEFSDNTECEQQLSRKQACLECWGKFVVYMKRFITFFLSHVGLAVLVLLYVIMGGYVFYYVEQGYELQVKNLMRGKRYNLTHELLTSWRASNFELWGTVRAHANKSIQEFLDKTPEFLVLRTNNELRDKLWEGLSWYLAGFGWPRHIIPTWWFLKYFDAYQNNLTRFEQDSLMNYTRAYFKNERNFMNFTVYLERSIDEMTRRMEVEIDKKLELHAHELVKAIKDDGWNGADGDGMIDWTIESGMLYAVTIITTIGYGHVTPHTVYGRLLTIVYAVFGIPLFFCYLTNNGNYLASIFQTCYIKMCKPSFKAIGKCCKRCCCCRCCKRANKFEVIEATTSTGVYENLSNERSPENRRVKNSDTSIPMSSSAVLMWTDSDYTHGPNCMAEHFQNYYPKSPNYRLTDDWDAYVIPLETNPELQDDNDDFTQCPLSSQDPRRLSVYKQPPSPRLQRAKQQARNSNSTSSSDPSSPVPLSTCHTDTRSTKKTTPECMKKDLLRPPKSLETHSTLSSPRQSINSRQSDSRRSVTGAKKMSQGSKTSESSAEEITVPITVTLCTMAVYILLGAFVFTFWEKGDFIKWSYFCFVTLSTIGFGDIVPGTEVNSDNPKEKLIIVTVYMAVGLSVFAMCFKLMQEEVIMKLKRVGRAMGLLESASSKNGSDEGSMKMRRTKKAKRRTRQKQKQLPVRTIRVSKYPF